MAYESIRYEVTEGVAVITLDRPDTRNAFNGDDGSGAVRGLSDV